MKGAPGTSSHAPGWSGSELVSVNQVGAKVLCAKWASIRSRHAIAAAHDDLESHQLWLDRHRATWDEEAKLYESRLNRESRAQGFTRLAFGLLLIGPITFLALLRLTAGLLPNVRDLFVSSVSWLHALVRLTRKHVRSHLSWWSSTQATRNHNKSPHCGRIAGLDGPLCTGQPASSSSDVVPESETGLLKVRLVVALFGAVIIGFLAAAQTSDTHEEPVERPPNVLEHSGPTTSLPPAASNQSREVERSAPDTISGFAVVPSAPAAQRVSLAEATITEIISLTRPLPNTLEQPDAIIEAEVTIPIRKPIVKRVKSKPSPTKQKHQLTLWERLPWLR
jgi:hypothetical protein